MKQVGKLLATVGEYKDPQSGETKKRRIRVGTVFENEQGQRSIKIDSTPVGPEWSGWLSEYPMDDRRDDPS